MLHAHVYNSLQKVFKLSKKILHTSTISESIKFLVKKYLREVIMLSKDFTLYHTRKTSLP